MGRTNKNGRIFLANLGSYIDNTISIDDKDVPFDYTISEKELHISPALHSGSVIHFDINRLQIIQGLLNIKVGNSFIPAENVDLIVVINQIPKTFPTGKEGEFYVENLKSGKYPASFDQGNRHCQFELVIPESKEMIIDLGKLYVCYFPK
jgi:outer membrane usher protein FimD/PapC